MIANSKIMPTLPVVDLNRAKKFYHETLGLKVSVEDSMGIVFETGGGCELYVYPRAQTKADHTVASFEVEDIESEVNDLRNKGIKFEEYEIPSMGLKTVNGIAAFRSEGFEEKTAWFKDTEGNILALRQRVSVREGSRRETVGAGVRPPASDWEDPDIYC